MASIWIAAGSRLAAYDESNVTLHVVQHVLLMMVAPPLLALGHPVTLACQAGSRTTQRWVIGLNRTPVVRTLSFPPITWMAYFGSMYAYFLITGLYDQTIRHPLLHSASHLVFLVAGYLYWQPLVAGHQSTWRLSLPARLLAIVAGMPFELFLGLSFVVRTRAIDPINTLTDTHRSGQIFWMLAMLISGVWAMVMAGQWLRQVERHAWREDRRAQVVAAESRVAAASHGLHGVADGWTVPAWRVAALRATDPGPEAGPTSGP